MYRVMMRYIAFRIKIDEFFVWLCSVKWINIQIWGSDDRYFSDYKVISKQRIRMPNGKVKWPKTKYNHVKVVDEALVTGAA
jgi:hypothetical protein